MARVAPVVPAETDILCEKCGYTLNGLPATSNCPECGQTIAESTIDDRRLPPNWESSPAKQSLAAFAKTSGDVLLRTTHFFRTLTTRGDLESARRFAQIHWCIAAFLFGTTAFLHAMWYASLNTGNRANPLLQFVIWILVMIATYVALSVITSIAAKLTNWEATYRGLRMPLQPVLRGMYYHAAHYLPVGVIALVTVFGYTTLFDRGLISPLTASTYLYVLCGEVVIGAVYLFQTYWIAMRNMMYANR